MLQFKSLEASHVIQLDEKSYPILEKDVDSIWWNASELVDGDHEGPAVIQLGESTVVLEEDDWVRLYAKIHEYIMTQLDLEPTAIPAMLH